MRLILVRHGESIGNQENRLQGQQDYELTQLGMEQALLTGARLGREGIAALYTSPLMRASATAEAIAAAVGLEPQSLTDVSEYHFGDMSGQTYAEVRQHFTGSTALPPVPPPGPPVERVYPGEEGRDNFFRRVTVALAAVVAKHPGESVAVVSHGGPIALFCQSVLGLEYKRPMPFSIDNCSLTIIEYDDSGSSRPVLATLNDVSHLEPLRHRAD